VDGRLVVMSEQDHSTYSSFSAWRGARAKFNNTYDMITTEDGILLRTIKNSGQYSALGGNDESTPDDGISVSLPERVRFRLYHGHTPLEYVDYMTRAFQHDLQRHADLVCDWPKVAERALGEAVKAHIRFQYGLRWADKTQPCLYYEQAAVAAVDRGDETAMDHVIPVSELAAAVLNEDRDFDHRVATLVRAWLCPVAHITKASHDRLGASRHPNPDRPFERYTQAGVIAVNHEGNEVARLTLEEHFGVLRGIEWVEPLIKNYIDRYTWDGLKIIDVRS